MTAPARRALELVERGGHSLARFTAMASPCEVLLHGLDTESARQAGEACAREAWRIEDKFSRYRNDNPVHALHRHAGQPFEVDGEFADLLDFANQCHQLSDGLFDITSGILRQAWSFRPGATFPAPETVTGLLPRIGWEKVQWRRPRLTLPTGMEIDLGGIGKEYAVDKAWHILRTDWPQAAFLVNFGGDLRAHGAPTGQPGWQIGIENPQQDGLAVRQLSLSEGALATSGDARRYLMHQGRRYGHILNPKTGYPIENAPRSVTVAADTCLQAGMLATFAMLHGEQAEAFLEAQECRSWVLR